MKLTLTQTMSISVAAVTLASLITLVGFSSYTLRQMSRELTEVRMRKTADLMALALQDAIISDDLAKIDSMTDAVLSAGYGVERMCVFNQKDVRISRGRCSQATEAPVPGNQIVESPVIVAGKSFGYVGVAYDPAQRYQQINQIERRLFFLATGALLITLMVTCYLGHVFHIELDALVNAFSAMEKGGQLRTLRKTPTTELQRITEAFNSLINQQKENERGT